MQTQAVIPNLGQSPDAAQSVVAANTAVSAKALALDAAGGDFLSLLMSGGDGGERAPVESKPREETPESDSSSEGRDRQAPADSEEVAEPDATALPIPQQVQPNGGSAEASDGPAVEPVKPASPSDGGPQRETSQTSRDNAALKASVEAAAVESRPRASLAAGTSQVALAAQTQPEAQTSTATPDAGRAQTDAQSQAQTQTQSAKGEPLQTSQRPDLAQVARGAAQGREQAPALHNNTTMAGLEAIAQNQQAEKPQAAQNQSAQQLASQAQAGQSQPGSLQSNSLGALASAVAATQAHQQQAGKSPAADRGLAAAHGAGAFTNGAATANSSPTALGGVEGLASPTGMAQSAKADATSAAANAARLPQPAVDQVAIRIQKAAAAGQDRIQIKLNPAELGRVDVKLEFQTDGGVRAVVSVERPETFDLLQRDARSLERALQDAGFKPGQTSLSFEMQNGGQGQGFAGDGSGPGADEAAQRDPGPAPAATDIETAQDAQIIQSRQATADGRVDLRI